MNQCISLREFARLVGGDVEQVLKSAKRLRPALPSSCEKFHKDVRTLELALVSYYKLAVYFAKQTTDLRELCGIWQSACEVCDSVLDALKSLKEAYPDCGK